MSVHVKGIRIFKTNCVGLFFILSAGAENFPPACRFSVLQKVQDVPRLFCP